MADKSESNSSRGLGFLGLLGIVFIALKLTHVIAWSWLWVLAPLWGPLCAGFVALIAFVVIATIAERR